MKVPRALAGFHLDRLAAEGLLETSFRRLTRRSGPGAGRPAKLYRRSDQQLTVNVPPRSYELAARIFAKAIDTSGTRKAETALQKTARNQGRRMGAAARIRMALGAHRKRILECINTALDSHGYEPRQERNEIRLRNCPFHGLVGDHRELVCGMNLALIQGMLDGLKVSGVKAVLDPRPGLCCVAVRV